MKMVMVFGTFDTIHPGHLNFIKQAREYGYITVVVARNRNVLKIKKKKPNLGERKRLNDIKKVKLVKKVILGHIKNPYRVIEINKPDIICLGYDQTSFTSNLKKKFPRIKIIRLRAYKPSIYKSSKLK